MRDDQASPSHPTLIAGQVCRNRALRPGIADACRTRRRPDQRFWLTRDASGEVLDLDREGKQIAETEGPEAAVASRQRLEANIARFVVEDVP